jgi:YHS domain-containing protein
MTIEHATKTEELQRDPICGALVHPDSPHRAIRDGIERLFCSERCLTKFCRFTHDQCPEEEHEPGSGEGRDG